MKRSDVPEAPAKGLVLLPMRWIVERTFGWLVKTRRFVRDYERNPPASRSLGLPFHDQPQRPQIDENPSLGLIYNNYRTGC